MFSHAVSAQEVDCFEASPAFKQLNDDYYDLSQGIELLPSEVKQVQTLTKKLKGKWQGSLEEIYCYGSDQSPRIKNSKNKVEAIITSDSKDLLVINLEVFDQGKGSNKKDKLYIVTKGQLYQLQLSEGNIESNRKVKASSGMFSKRIRESVISLSFKQRTMILVADFYSQGHFEARRKLVLKR